MDRSQKTKQEVMSIQDLLLTTVEIRQVDFFVKRYDDKRIGLWISLWFE